MDIKASIDIGDSLKQLLEKLAEQIGTTADKIFPWYVKQQILMGWGRLIVPTVLLIFGLVLIRLNINKCNWENPTRYNVMTIVGIIIFVVSFVILSTGGIISISMIINPEYYALQQLLKDLTNVATR